MATPTKNLYINQGATFSTNVQYTDYFKNPISLTGYNAYSQIRTSYTSANAYANLNVSIYDSANGNITLSLDAANTALLNGGRYLYDVVANNSNTYIRIIEGIMTVNPGITNYPL
jgi:hypothetical protein